MPETVNVPAGYAAVATSITVTGSTHVSQITYGVQLEDTDAQTACEDLNLAYAANVMPASCATFHQVLTELWVGPARVPFQDTANTAGSISGNPGPVNTAVLVKKTTAAGGRANRGRMFCPGVAESQVDDGISLNGTGLTAWQTALSGFFTDVIGSDHVSNMVLFHPVAAPTVVTSLQVSSRLATQRRRLR